MRITRYILLLILVFSLAACNSNETKETEEETNKLELEQKDKSTEKVSFQTTMEAFKPKDVPSGTYGTYNIKIDMNKDLTSSIDAQIEIENLSQEAWNEIKLYFIPQSLIKGQYGNQYGQDGAVHIDQVIVDDEVSTFSLSEQGILTIPLKQQMKAGDKTFVDISYNLRPSTNGARLRREAKSVYLAQWYPMLPTYQNGKWNIEDYTPRGESYFTTNGSYTIEYQLPTPYYVMTSANDQNDEPHQSGTVQGDHLKEMYISFLNPKDWYINHFPTNNTDLRMAVKQSARDMEQEWQQAAQGSFTFFEKNIGNYPLEQLDMIQNSGGMEYAGIIEGSSKRSGPRANATIIHEIAHQWFYFQVNNDPYYDAWVDEGITEFANTLYQLEIHDNQNDALRFARQLNGMNGPDKPANLPLTEYERVYAKAVYGQPVAKLWSLFENNGGQNAALEFLSTYYNLYQGKQVTTEEFVRFFRAYVKNEPEGYLESWLNLN